MVSYVVRVLGVSVALFLVPNSAHAQGPPHPRWEIPGFDFGEDGVWRTKARLVREHRARLLAGGQFRALNAAPNGGGIQPAATAVTGVLRVPALLFRYKDSPASAFVVASYDDVLFAPTPTGASAGRPYTYRSYYNELSNGVFDIQGTTFGYANLDSNEVYYSGGTSTGCQSNNPYGSSNCNGIFSGLATTRMREALTKSLDKLDPSINFAQFVDTATGFVPLVLFLHQAIGGECGPPSAPQNHLWAHRSSLATYSTQDDWPGHPGEKVKIRDYILQGAVGGQAIPCDPAQIMAIGTVAHESGHGLGLPDLYDTGDATEGVGQWDLMSSGSFTTGFSPARMSAWSLNELGWITIRQLSATGTYTFDAAPLSDTAFYVRVQGLNPRGEYFLLENRQRQEADTALIRFHCARAGSPGCPGGLLIWHIDSAKVAQARFSNSVNTGAIHGVAVVQADSFQNLDAAPVTGNFCPSSSMFFGCSNRGDAGDLFPGATNNTRGLVFRTNPAALKNSDGSFAGLAIDSVTQLVSDGTLRFRLRFGALTVVRASDPTATIQFEGASYTTYRDLLEEGQGYAVNFTDPQVSADGRTRFHFGSWSDGGAQSHTYIGQLDGDTLTANLTRDFKLNATAGANGAIQVDTAGVDITSAAAAGTFIREGRSVTLTATPDAGVQFGGWCGDTTSSNTVVAFSMQKPFTVLADFGALTFPAPPARPNTVMGATYLDSLESSGGGCAKSWALTGGALPQGLTLGSQTGVVSGFARETGNFTYTVTVSSGPQDQTKTFTMSVTAPALATSDVTMQLLGPGAPLNADQLRYLDFLGNNNNGFDIGDFLAWVKATGAPLSAAALQQRPRERGGRP